MLGESTALYKFMGIRTYQKYSQLNILAIAIMTTLLHSMGGFLHLDDIPPQDVSNVLRVLWATQSFGIIGVIPGKCAVAITIVRIRGTAGSRTLRWTLYGLSILFVLVGIPTLLLQFLQCSPSYALWTAGAPAQCLDPSMLANYAIFSGG